VDQHWRRLARPRQHPAEPRRAERDRAGVRDGPARIDDYADASGPAADLAREEGLRASVGVPITVEGRLWGVVMVSSRREPLRADTEARLAGFTELVGTALANTEAQAALTTSRARIVSTADQTRRRIERDLHDGAQQQLVSLALQLWAAQAAVPPELEELQAELDRVAVGLTGVQDELREFARGIHPAVLAEGGLGPALRNLARRSPVPVDLQVHVEGRLPEQVEVTAYYVVAEALTNVAKHAGASLAQVEVDADDGLVRVSVRDDGVGGADPARGSGLVGLKDRVEATGGTLRVDSRAGQGTRLLVELPIDAGQPPDST
jgi:signal transduction histidine kinase